MVGTLANAINAEETHLSINGSEYVTIFDIDEGGDHEINSIVTRAGRADFFAAPIRELSFKALVSSDVHAALKTLNTRNTRGALPVAACILSGMSIGTGNISVPFSASVPHVRRLAGETGYFVVEVRLRIDNSTY